MTEEVDGIPLLNRHPYTNYIFNFRSEIVEVDALDDGTPETLYFTNGRRVSNFNLRSPNVTEVNHVAELCFCLHSKLAHSAGDFRDLCTGLNGNGKHCECVQFTPVEGMCGCGHSEGAHRKAYCSQQYCFCTGFTRVSHHSRHAYQRGMKVTKKRLADLQPGDRVLAGWSASIGKLRLITQKTGAMVVTVTGRHPKLADELAGDQRWRDRMWIMHTDLGETLPVAGGADVLVVTA